MPEIISSTNDPAMRTRFAPEQSFTLLNPGPSWNSFEEFRVAGNAGLENIGVGTVALLNCKAGSFRIMRDVDFHRIMGIATDVARFQRGLRVVAQAARVAIQHPDHDHLQLFLSSASLIAECPELPYVDGHQSFEPSAQESADTEADDFDPATATIPRPVW